MPRPLPPSEAAKIEKVYIDESSQTGHRNLIIGGIVLPERFFEQFEQDILEARRPKLAAERASTDELCEMGWSEVGRGGFEAYKRVIDAYFDFEEKRIGSSEGTIEFHCSVVLTQVRGRTFSGDRGKKAFTNEVRQHCLALAIYHKTKLFRVHPDRRHSDDKEAKEHDSKLRNSLCSLLKNCIGDQRHFAVRTVESMHSHEVQALQVADLLIGAVAFRLNRHYDADKANPDKVRLCEYILRRGGAWNYIDSDAGTYREKRVGRFQIWPKRPAEARKNPPIRKKVVAAKKALSLSTPVTLSDLMREEKLLWVYCNDCGRERDLAPASLPVPPDTPVPDVGKRMRCSACGSRKINTKPELYPRRR
ncbi:MAG: DUF3800 domain-containing protein [Hyphomicrobium sp.]